MQSHTSVGHVRSLRGFILSIAALAMLAGTGAQAVTVSLNQTFLRPGAEDQDFLGQSMALLGSNLLVVGVPGEDVGATDAGTAYLFESLGGASQGRFIRMFQPPTPLAGSKCGSAVGTVGGNVLVGCPFDDTGATDAGVVQLFDGTTGELLHTFANPSPASGDRFGSALGGVGTVAVIGAPFDASTGTAYLFDADPGSPTFGNLLATLANPTPSANDRFGAAVAGVGSLALIASPFDDGAALDAGAAYLFDGDPLSATFGTLLATLTDPAALALENFGFSVAALGTDALIGEPGDSSGGVFSGGAVIRFDANPLSGSFGGHVRTYRKTTPVAGDQLGYSVAASGSNVLGGALFDDVAISDGGAAYLFNGATGAVLKTYKSPAPSSLENFGLAVAGAGSVDFAGAPSADATKTNQGALYEFQSGIPPVKSYLMPEQGSAHAVGMVGTNVVVGMDNDNLLGSDAGAVYLHLPSGAARRAMLSPEPQFDGQLGHDIVTVGTNLLVGAPFDGACCDSSDSGYGQAYLYDADTGSATFGSVLATFSDPNSGSFDSDYFGIAVGAAGTNLLIGAYYHDTPVANTGIVYVYDGNPASPTFGDQLGTVQPTSPTGGARFGYDIAGSGGRAVISALDGGPLTGGQVYLMDVDPGSPTFGSTLCTFVNPTPESGDNFGFSVALGATRALVGNPTDMAGSGLSNSGAAYLYDADPISPTYCSLLRTLLDPTPQTNENFAWSVAFLGSDILVGNLQEPRNTTKQGSVYLFDGESSAYTIINNPNPAKIFFSWGLATAGTKIVVGAGGAGTAYLFNTSTACGDGLIDAGEQCDDGNTANGDCCSSTCQYEPINQPCVVGGNVCYECNATGTCVAEIDHCSDGNSCTSDTCHPSLGCQHDNLPNNTACNDNNACTTNDKCQSGVCTPGTCNVGTVCGLCGATCQISGPSCVCQ